MIADRIRQARLAAGLTLGALGEQVGVSHTAIQKYEKTLLMLETEGTSRNVI
ncbi:MAG: helix-turn-helix domain-containing protein [Aquabacterium sp.]